jgi:hypothetical protein
MSVSAAATNVIKSGIRSVANAEKFSMRQRFEMMRNRRERIESIGVELDTDGASVEHQMAADDAFGHLFLKLTSIMVREQNVLTDFFGIIKRHVASNLSISDSQNKRKESLKSPIALEAFPETAEKWQMSLSVPRPIFKDSKVENRLIELMSVLFNLQGLTEALNTLIDTLLKYDQSPSIGMLVHVEYYQREHKTTCHTFILNLLDVMHKRIFGIYEKFVNEQIKNIEDTRITSKRRTGILPFMKTFPVVKY